MLIIALDVRLFHVEDERKYVEHIHEETFKMEASGVKVPPILNNIGDRSSVKDRLFLSFFAKAHKIHIFVHQFLLSLIIDIDIHTALS